MALISSLFSVNCTLESFFVLLYLLEDFFSKIISSVIPITLEGEFGLLLARVNPEQLNLIVILYGMN